LPGFKPEKPRRENRQSFENFDIVFRFAVHAILQLPAVQFARNETSAGQAMCGKPSSSGNTFTNFGRHRDGAYRQILAALAAAATACAVVASPAIGKADQPNPSVGERLALKSVAGAIVLRIDPVAVEPVAEDLQAKLAPPQFVRPLRHAGPAGERFVGGASTYNPTKPGDRSGGAETASGELYEANAWAAAIQVGLRSAFAGVRFGRSYRPAFALVTSGDKSAIVKINDVGPLLPGRVIDLAERPMRYFDVSFQRGVLPDVTVTPLAGDWRAGPVEGGPALTMAGDCSAEPFD
jgi:rare lipoprotein A